MKPDIYIKPAPIAKPFKIGPVTFYPKKEEK